MAILNKNFYDEGCRLLTQFLRKGVICASLQKLASTIAELTKYEKNSLAVYNLTRRGSFRIKTANLSIRRRCTIAADEGRPLRLNCGALPFRNVTDSREKWKSRFRGSVGFVWPLGIHQVKSLHFESTTENNIFPGANKKNLTQVQNHYNHTLCQKNFSHLQGLFTPKRRDTGNEGMWYGRFCLSHSGCFLCLEKDIHNLKMVFSSQSSEWSNVVIKKINILQSI